MQGYGSAMQFGVLGRLEVRDGDAPLIITAPSRRLVLAALLARANSLVTASTLIDDLWGVAAPRSAVGSLRSHVARLRDDLGRDPDLLLTEGDGYRLRVEPHDLDAARFETLVQQAGEACGPETAMGRYDEALALWRGEAYVEFGEAPFAVHERIRLAELRALARERRTDLALAAGVAPDLVGELQQRVRSEPYRERGWEQLALALYRAGRQADALNACRRARDILSEDLGVDPGPGLQALEDRLLRQDPDLLVAAPQPVPAVMRRERCPYLGLAGYDEADAALFVGRERLTSLLAGRLADQSVVVVTGASGVGKSSLVRAGLVPALRAGALPGSAAWRIDVTTPTEVRLPQLGRRIDVLVVDQAEQMFTALDADERAKLAAALVSYVSYAEGRLILVLRSDFYGRLASVEALAPLADYGSVLVGPMRADELRRALVEPAAAVGLRLEDDLVEALMDDVAGQPEPLPLLSEAMVRTWQRRDGDTLTLDGYRRSGEIAGALEAVAEECYAKLEDEAQRAARHLLVRMAAPSGSGGWVRRRLARADTAGAGPEREALDAFVAARLAVVADDHVELAHDALLERWPRLRGWLDERLLAAELVDHLDQAATAWRTARRQDADLYRGPRLAAALDWRTQHPEDVSPTEEEFLTASARASDADLAAARAQAAREAHGRRRLRRVVVALVAVAVLAVTGGTVALSERGSARSQARRAEQAALTADANRLAAVARGLSPDQRDAALLLATEGYRLEPTDETAGGLQTTLMQTPPGLDHIIRYRSTSRFPHLDHSGRLLAAPGADGRVDVYDLVTNRIVRTLQATSPRQFGVFSGDDTLVAAGSSDGTVDVWDMNTGRLSGAPLRAGSGVVRPLFDPRDNNRIYVVTAQGAVTTWDRSNPAKPRETGSFAGLPLSDGNANLTISSDGRLLAAGGLDPGSPGAVPQIWDTRTGKPLRSLAGSIGNFAATGDTLPFGVANSTKVLDARSGRVESTLPHTGGTTLALTSPSGRRVAVPEQVGNTSVVSVFDVQTHRRVGRPLALQANFAYPLGFLPGGRLVTTDPDAAAIWTLGKTLPPLGVSMDTSADRVRRPGFPAEAPYFIPGSQAVAVLGAGPPVVHDPATGRVTGKLFDSDVGPPLDARPDGRLAVGVVAHGIGIWDIAAHRLLARLPGVTGNRTSGYSVSALSWSPKGNLVAADAGGAAVDVWDVSNPRRPSLPRSITPPLGGVIDDALFTPDGQHLVVLSGAGNRLSMIDIGTGRDLWTHTVAAVDLRQIAISPDGSTIAYDTGDINAGQVALLDAANGSLRSTIDVPSYGGVGFLDGGRWLIITSDQPGPAAQLFDATTGEPFGVPFPTQDVDQHPLVVDPAGGRFAEEVAWERRQPVSLNPLVWDTDPARWVQDACAIAGRNLTRAEWQEYLPDRQYQRTCPGWPAAVTR
jgi:DNA-binding SARP family transcriptional activator/WD40 repeat protein